MRNLLYAATATTLLALTPAANADVILTFGQTGGANTITGTASATGTTWGGTNIPVNITQIDAPACYASQRLPGCLRLQHFRRYDC